MPAIRAPFRSPGSERRRIRRLAVSVAPDETGKRQAAPLEPLNFDAASLTADSFDGIEAEQIDDRYFETPYYLTPQKGGQHAYALLREALSKASREVVL